MRGSRSRLASVAHARAALITPSGSAWLVDQAAICRLTVAAVANAPASSAACRAWTSRSSGPPPMRSIVPSPDSPQAKTVLVGQNQRVGEGLVGSGEVALALALPEYLQCLTGQLVTSVRLCAGQCSAGQHGGVVELAFSEGHAGGQHRGVAGNPTGFGQLLGEVELVAGPWPIGRGDRGPSQQQMRPRSACRWGGRAAKTGQQPLADLADAVRATGRDEYLAQHLVDLGGTSSIVADQASGPCERDLGAGQSAPCERASCRLEV